MDKLNDKMPTEAGVAIEAVVRKESEDALRRFRSGDFASRLNARLAAPPARPPFFLFRKPFLFPALGVLVLAAAAFILVLVPGRDKARVEAGFRLMTESLSRSELLRAVESPADFIGPDETTPGRDALPFARVLFRAAAGSESGSKSGAPSRGGAPLRPLFNPKERFQILYGDRAILRVLTNIANQKEV